MGLSQQRQAGVLRKDVLFEGSDDVLCELKELGERWKQNLSFDDLRFGECYVVGRLNVVVVFRRVAWPSPDFFAVLRRYEAGFPGADPESDALTVLVGGEGGNNVPIGLGNNRRYDHSVFVHDVEAGQCQEQFIPSWVWFHRLHKINDVLPGTTYLVLQRLLEFPAGLTDGKSVPGVDLIAVKGYGLANQVIQCSPKVMDAIADQEAPFDGRVSFDFADSDPLAGVRVDMFDDMVRVSCPKVSDSGFEITKVLLGPLDL